MTTRHSPLLLALAAVTACADTPPKSTADSAAAPAPVVPPGTPAPAVFRARFETSRGTFVIEAHREWAPNGVDRFHHLVSSGYFDNVRFFRVIPNFMAQFGIHGDPSVARAWEPLTIPDDPVTQSNKRGYVSFATIGPNTRTTQLFINFKDNVGLDAQGFSPIGMVVEGMSVVDSLYGGYGEGAPGGAGPSQGRIHAEGNAYLERDFPRLDFIRTARIVAGGVASDSAARKSK